MGFNNLTPSELQRIFMPYAAARTEFVRDNGVRFSHYTSAYVGLQILENEEVWLRNSRIMNDFQEMHHGQRCLSEAWKVDRLGVTLRRTLNELHSDLGERVHDSLVQLYEDRNENTFLLSVSEHGSSIIDEDSYGRLSMWRAYGGNVNVAFVLNNGPFIGDSDALMAFTSPVLYADVGSFAESFNAILDNVKASAARLSETDPDEVFRGIFVALHFAILATKHPGFAEEKEWRILHSPNIWKSERLKPSDEIIDGVPQRVFKIPLKDVPENRLVGVEIPQLVDRIIIGPTQFPNQMRDVFVRKLEECGVDDPLERVIVSDIPLRR